jgi:IclR family pca regulon transcriptional regulator
MPDPTTTPDRALRSAEPKAARGKAHSDHIQSLERGLAVLGALGPERSGLTLSDVARITGLTRAAARRFLLTWSSSATSPPATG